MKILAHRGFWNNNSEKNSLFALHRALESGYGFESDLRDYHGKLVISHNIADAESQPASEVFQLLREYQDQFCFAINIKADGLKETLLEQLNTYQITNYFAFDMSVPQMVEYAELGLKYFTRLSEIEAEPVLYETAIGVWVDGFWGNDWISEAILNHHIHNGKKVCIVSPELHGRKYLNFWYKIKTLQIDFRQILLCTDHPAKAKEIFNQLLD